VALAARVAGKSRLMVHENWRFRPWYRTLRQWLARGDLGQVQWATMTMLSSGLVRDASGRFPDLVRQPFMANEKRLMIAEVLIHHLDVVRWLFGPLRLVAARTAHRVPEVAGEDLARDLPRSCDGRAGHRRRHARGPRIRGRDGGSPGDRRQRSERLARRRRAQSPGPAPRQESFDFERDYQASFDGAIGHFVDCLASGGAFETDVLDNLETLRLVDQAYAAADASRATANEGSGDR